ncbi:LOW QUALITY PROTEIN: hypothetical protein HID58_051486 [Brassica napus]|uniref:Uncharacterized protein n=1 Tax=Brassica napus TaxID=3708 RepID=A0ABQ8A9R7_BRANA|nr:LOW QUALITY PROTEIN: hypothetical protein HID58_051486 [Brassica napus]
MDWGTELGVLIRPSPVLNRDISLVWWCVLSQLGGRVAAVYLRFRCMRIRVVGCSVVYGGFSPVFGGLSLFVFMIESFEVTRLLRVRLAVSVSSLSRLSIRLSAKKTGLGSLTRARASVFRASIGSVEAQPARRPSGMLAFPVSRHIASFLGGASPQPVFLGLFDAVVVLTFAFLSILPVDSCGAALAVWYAPSPFHLSGLRIMISGELKL